MSTTIVMPQLGESVAEGVIGKWLKNEGDHVDKDEPIVEVITDKVNAEIPSPVAGVLEKITQPEGATVAVGEEIAVIGSGDGGSQEPVPAGVAQSSAPVASSGGGNGNGSGSAAISPAGSTPGYTAPVDPERGERVRSSPLVRRLAEQYGISLGEVPGTGIGGRVSKQDILQYVEARSRPAAQPAAAQAPSVSQPAAPPPAPQGQPAPGPAASTPAPSITPPVQTTPTPQPQPASPAAAGPRQLGANEELVPVSPLRKMIAGRMAQSVYTIPHATTMTEVDMTNVVRYREAQKDAYRQREGVPLSYVAFVVKAVVEALKAFPMVNAEWAGDNIILKKNVNINVAVDAPEGLTTPVIHGADEKSLSGLSKAIYDLAMRARNKKLTVDDMQGGTFTVNNTGAIGSTAGVSIINYPQAGILSAAAIIKRPVVIEQDGQDLIAVRSMMNLSFTFDHRLLDGGYAAGFAAAVKQKLENWPADYPLY